MSARRMVTFAALFGAAFVWLEPAKGDPPPHPDSPPVFCFRITDVERLPNDVSGAGFKFEFEVLNWTDKPAHGITLCVNVGTFAAIPDKLGPWFGGPPGIVEAYVDEDGRGGKLGGADISAGVFDDPAIHSGRGRGDIADHLNLWIVDQTAGLTTHGCVTWVTGPDGVPIPNRDIISPLEEDPPDPAESFLQVPGLGTDALGDSAVDGGPTPYTDPDPLPPFRTGGAPDPDGSGNVNDGYVFTVCDFHPGEFLILNWFLLDENLDPLGTAAFGNAAGFGTFGLVRLPVGAGMPGGVLGGNTGFGQSGASFFDSVWMIPADEGVGAEAAAFAVEFGAAITAPFVSDEDNIFNAPVNTAVIWPDSHPCAPSNCPGDIDGDGQVSTLDLLILLGSWGRCPL